MREACVKAVQDALGRDLGPGESKGIEDRIRLHMRLLARRDAEGWRTMSGTERVQAAAKAAAQELMAKVAKSRQQLSLAIASWDRNEQSLAKYAPNDYVGRAAQISRWLAFDPAKGGERSIDSRATAIATADRGKLLAALKVAHPKVFGLFENTSGIHDLIREIYGEDTGNAAAKAGASAWRDYAAESRDRYNSAGGHVGDLGETYFPNHHSKYRVGNAGFENWFRDIEPLLDKGKYLNTDGSPLSGRDLKDFFGHAFNTVITDGDSKAFTRRPQGEMVGPQTLGPAGIGHSLFADRNSAHRQVFFKDANSFIQYQAKYGDHSFLSTMLGHVNRMARDTAVLESQGPFADQSFQFLNERERNEAKKNFTDEKSLRDIDKKFDYNAGLWRYVTGQRDIVDSKIGGAMQAFRNVMTGLKLGKVVITAMGDEAGMATTALANRVPYSEMTLHQMQMLNPLQRADRDAVESFGIGLNSMIGALNRYAGEDMGKGASAKFANLIMRVTGAERMWDTRRQAVALTLMHQIGTLSRLMPHVGGLTEGDHGVLARKGITDAEWQVYRRAELNADGAVTPHEIWAIPDEKLKDLGDPTKLKRDATTSLHSHIEEESGMGVMQTGARERAKIEQLGKAIGISSEGPIGKSLMLFKTFASSVMMKHWARMGSLGTLGQKIQYGTILAVYGTAIAALGNQVRAFIAGQQPRDMTKGRFWAESILRGGGLGYFGDFMYDELNERDENLVAALGGPLATSAQDVWNITGAAAFKKARGEKQDEAAKLIRFGRDNNPLLNVWYTSAAWDHMLWYQMQEQANPGYLNRMQTRQQKFGRTYFWDPKEALPSKGPDFGKAVGE